MAEAVRRDVEAGLLSPGQTAGGPAAAGGPLPQPGAGRPLPAGGGEGPAPPWKMPAPPVPSWAASGWSPPPARPPARRGWTWRASCSCCGRGSLLEAQRTLMKYLPMARTVCRACGRCGEACVKSQPVGLAKLMDWLGDTIDSHPEIFFIPPSGDSRKWVALPSPTLAALSAALLPAAHGQPRGGLKRRPGGGEPGPLRGAGPAPGPSPGPVQGEPGCPWGCCSSPGA